MQSWWQMAPAAGIKSPMALRVKRFTWRSY